MKAFIRHIPWFKRVWVIQEVVLSKSAILVYDNSTLSLKAILEARARLVGMAELSEPRVKAVARALFDAFAVHGLGKDLLDKSRHSNNPNDVALSTFLAEARFSRATDCKDKILALYGLLLEAGVNLPAVAYRNSVASIYRDAAIAIIRSTGSLRILELVDGLGSTPSLPSWVPDWSSSKHSIGLFADSRVGKVCSRPIYSFAQDENMLELRGIVIDKIAVCAGCYMHPDERLGDPEHYSSWTKNPPLTDPFWRGILDRNPRHHSTILHLWNLKVLQQYVQMILGDGESPATASEHAISLLYNTLLARTNEAEEYQMHARAWFQQLCSDHYESSVEQDPHWGWVAARIQTMHEPMDHELHRQLQQLLEYKKILLLSSNAIQRYFHQCVGQVRYQKLFRTVRGQIGMASWPAETGDEIWLCSGLRVPLVIRPSDGGCRLIGQAYLEGHMHSEGWPQDEEQLRKVTLR